MHLKLEELQQVAKKTIKEEQKRNALREELFRVFGPPVMVSKNCEKVAEAVNEQLDFFESTGQDVQCGAVKTSVLIEASISNSAILRKVAARLLPVKIAARLLEDTSSAVRCAAAKRLPYSHIKKVAMRFPNDDQLRTIIRKKKIIEAGLPKPKELDEPFDLYGEVPLGDAIKQKAVGDLSDTWYKLMANDLCSTYGGNLEGRWEETAATRHVASHYSTTGVKLDRDKLLKAIYDCIEAHEDAILGEGSLKALSNRLLIESYLDDAVMPVIDNDRNNPVADLLESNFSSAQYINESEKLFSIRSSSVPAGIKKYRIGEEYRNETLIPVNGKIPGGSITAIVEQALDRYVASWNKRQAIDGEPYHLSWGPHALGNDMIGFNLQLK